MGRVVAPGPEVKLAITRSSSDRVKASIQPAATAGAMFGRVMAKNVRQGGQPRSSAASSRERSKSTRRDCTTTATKPRVKVVWGAVTVQKHRVLAKATTSNSDAS